MRVLGLIPARGGSKGIRRKNIRPLLGKPLLQYTAEAARAAHRLTRIILSTEDEEVAAVGRNCGLEVPFRRSPELARDDTPMLPVVQDALRWFEDRGERFDAVCLLQPTSPLRRPEYIDACIDLLEERGADAVVTVLPVPPEYNPHWVFTRDDAGFVHLFTGDAIPINRRQDLPLAFHREGSVYVSRRDVVMEKNTLYGARIAGYEMEAGRSVNIDGPEDWERAERLLSALACSPGGPV